MREIEQIQNQVNQRESPVQPKFTKQQLLQECEQQQDHQQVNTKLLYEFLPIIGKTPLLFFVAETQCGASDRVKALIHRHGGICTEFHECCTIQIKPKVELDMSSFYPGEIYEEAWLYKCVSAN